MQIRLHITYELRYSACVFILATAGVPCGSPVQCRCCSLTGSWSTVSSGHVQEPEVCNARQTVFKTHPARLLDYHNEKMTGNSHLWLTRVQSH